MYKKLFKNFVGKNISVFLLIYFSLSLSLFGYIFSDSLSKNFIDNIGADSQVSLGADIVIDIDDQDPSYFYNNIGTIIEDNNIELAEKFELNSSLEYGDEIITINLIYFTELFPFYEDFKYEKTGTSSGAIISQDLYNKLGDDKTVGLPGGRYQIYGIYSELPQVVNSFLSTENVFIQKQYFADSGLNETNSLVDKEFFLKFENKQSYEKVKAELEGIFTEREIDLYETGGERFEEVIANLKSYINYAVLFSFFLTVTIIFLSITSFFLKERKQLSVLRILGMDNLRIIKLFGALFFLVFIAGYITALILNIGVFQIVQNFELSSAFQVYPESLIQGILLAVILFIFSFGLPVAKIISSQPNQGLQENFFNNLSKKDKISVGGAFAVLLFILGLFLGYSYFISIIITLGILVFLFIFSFINSLLLRGIFKGIQKTRTKRFYLFDAVRNTIRPGNLTFLLNLSFFIIFFVIFFISILFGNFYNRLAIDLENDQNFFVLNINQNTFDKIDPEYKESAFSLIRGRIIEINGLKIKDFLGGSESRGFTREFNITDTIENVGDVIRGKSLSEGGVSVDNDFSKELGVEIGDILTFQILGLEKELEIVNIRASQDISINPFFYFQVDKQEFEKFPKQYFLSRFVENEEIPEIKKYFFDISNGTVTFIEVEKILAELKEVSTKVLLVIKVLFGYLIIFCLLSIVVVGLFYKQFQKRKSYLYHMLGTIPKENKKRIFYEYIVLAILMLIISIVGATAGSYIIISLNDFIVYSPTIYLYCLGLIFFIFLILTLGIYKFS